MQTMISGGAGLGAAGVAGAGATGVLNPAVALPIAAGMAAPNIMARAMTGTGGFGWLRDYLANQATRDQLGLKSVPFALLPGASNTPRLENRR